MPSIRVPAALGLCGLLTLGAAALVWAPAGPASGGGECPPAQVSGTTFSRAPQPPPVIPDNDPEGASDCMTISDPRTISDLDVRLDIRHSWVGDLVVTLFHEDTGTSTILVDRPGVPATGIGCGEDNIDAVLDDEAALPVEDQCGPGTPAIAGRLIPSQPLAVFDGQRIAGTWTLLVTDQTVGDAGTINGWSLIATLPGAAAGDVNCDGSVTSIDAALVLQLSAGLLASLRCSEAADTNLDGAINAIDAALILQFTAGLLGRLPP